ncbi:MAG TPA: peroxiredoxin [Candidatus Dormibacteraeota bacterium]|nr:peroxiredoxin [Candidatus Dormibacteraeota bacterium]
MPIGAGQKLPDFDLPTSAGGRVGSSDLLGRRTVLYFYPKDDTPGCTVEAHEFTTLVDDFRARGVDVFGVSPDSPSSHDRFVKKCELGVPLISDQERVLCEALGVWQQKSFAGRTYMGVVRSTFLVGPDGTVEQEWRQVRAPGHAAAVLASL